MPYFDTEIEVDVYDFLSSCSHLEIEGLIESLQEDGWLIKKNITKEESMTIMDEEWLNITNKLYTLRIQLSVEEEKLIKEITNRY